MATGFEGYDDWKLRCPEDEREPEPTCRECGEPGWLGICQECADWLDGRTPHEMDEWERQEAQGDDEDYARGQWLATVAGMEALDV
jgi:hypothetical protein